MEKFIYLIFQSKKFSSLSIGKDNVIVLHQNIYKKKSKTASQIGVIKIK